MTTNDSARRPALQARDGIGATDSLQELLNKISGHAALSDGRYADVLDQMQSKIERLEQVMKAARTPEPTPTVSRPAPDSLAHSSPPPRTAPRPAAFEEERHSQARASASAAASSISAADRAWLDSRLVDLSRNLTRSVADSTTHVLNSRLHDLETRIDTALDQATTQIASNGRAVAGLHTQVADLGSELARLATMLARLDGLEARLHDMADAQTLHHTSLSEAITKSRRRDNDGAQTAAVAQMTTMLENLGRDRLRGESQVVAILEALQLTVGRVIDRLDSSQTAPPVGALGRHPAAVPAETYDDQEILEDLIHASDVSGFESIASAQAAALQALHRGTTSQHGEVDADPRYYSSGRTHTAAGNSPAQASLSGLASLTRRLPFSSRTLAATAVALLVPLNVTVLGHVYMNSQQNPVAVEMAMTTAPETGSIDVPATAPAQDKVLSKNMAPPLPRSENPIQTASISTPAATPVAFDNSQARAIDPADTPVAIEGTDVNQAGSGVEVDMPPATVGPLSLRRAAAAGDSSAQFEVASRLAEGKGVNQDFKLAAKWYLRAASNGQAMAQYRLGALYERGLGVDKDPARARIWYKRAAEKGNIKSMHNLAVLSSNQASGNTNYADALYWFNEAADHNLPDSQYNLAVLYENGLAGSKDDRLAYKWFTIAARNGDSEAYKRRETVKARLSASDLAAAEADVAAFRSKASLALTNDARVAGEDWKKRQAGGGQNPQL